MSLAILSSESSAQCQVTRLFSPPFFTIANDSELYSAVHIVRVGDIFANLDVGTWYLAISGIVSNIGQALNFEDQISDPVRSMIISYPTRDNPDGSYDQRIYGSALGGPLLDAYRVLLGAFAETYYPSLSGENYVRHFNVSGKLQTKLVEDGWQPLSFASPLLVMDNIPRLNLVYTTYKVLGLAPLRIQRFDGNCGRAHVYDIRGIFERLSQGDYTGPAAGQCPFDDRSYGNRNLVSTTSSFNYVINDDGSLVVTYHTVCENISDGFWYSWDSKWTLSSTPQLPLVTPIVGSTYSRKGPGSLVSEFSFSNFESSPNSVRKTPTELSRTLTTEWYGDVITAMPSDLEAAERFGRSWSDDTVKPSKLSDLVGSFESAVRSSWSDIVPSATFSTVDAISKMQGSVNNNVLQTLAKIPEIATALPDIVEAVDVLGRLVRKDLSLSTLREILDLATSTHLQASFQWRPYYELITKYWPLMAPLLSHMFDEKHLTSGYGSFSFQIDKDLGRETVTLVTRTKIVVDVTLSGTLSAALTLDSAGLLPRFSRVWDLIPFTFVVNWFTGVNKFISTAETIGFSALVPTAYVHSFTLTSPLTEGELEVFEASSLGNPAAGLKTYIRDKTHYPPLPRYSRFPFGVPTQLPSTGLLGSLLYQLFLS